MISPKSISQDLLEYLLSEENKGKYPTRTFYGETFTALALSLNEFDEYKSTIERFIETYSHLDKSDDNFHWEFNNYSLLRLDQNLDSVEFEIPIDNSDLTFQHTKVTNWTLLRGLCRVISGESTVRGAIESLYKIVLNQNKSGFIYDDKNVRSFQYHSYSTTLLVELFDALNMEFFKSAFIRAIDYICNCILITGDTFYVGRGQNQIFGYGPLIYSLERAYKFTEDKKYKRYQYRLLDLIQDFQRPNGSIPLVLRNNEDGYPVKVDVNDPDYMGWYNYNNYFDYLPFLVYYLEKTSEIFDYVEIVEGEFIQESYHNENTSIYKGSRYDAAVSAPGGAISNDLPMPFICNTNSRLTPCYGGEEYGSSLYSFREIPIPWGVSKGFKISTHSLLSKPTLDVIGSYRGVTGVLKTIQFRKILDYKLKDFNLIGRSPVVHHTRNFDYYESKISVSDTIEFNTKIKFDEFVPVNYGFFNMTKQNHNEYKSTPDDETSLEIIIDVENSDVIKGEGYSAVGNYDILRKKLTNIQFTKGDIYEHSLDITLG